MADHFDGPSDRVPHATTWRRATASAAAALSLILLASGCGGPQVNYAIPEEVCGITVDQDLLRPLFPPGDRVQFDGDVLSDGKKAKSICQYYVDGNTALLVDSKRNSENVTAEQLAKPIARAVNSKMWSQSDGRIAGFDGNAYGTTNCSGTPSDTHGEPARTFTLKISVNHFTSAESVRPHLQKLMTTLLPKAARSRGC
ncbi:putative hypothetical protein [Streptomyces sp. NBRC 110611]|uniref:hypothetical protein n=1 Tax=Streptomyces sp. NBRC 110611 TaxID=1621259 RepID=UPI0008574027|nr:hypothetical protein [Streptomyces sp. NBRC 110611]GAU71098.1 putative hypothetical protein [Streptomyces sp. NBRC 110611]